MRLARQLAEALLDERAAGDAVDRGYTTDIAKTSPEKARAIVEKALSSAGRSIDEDFPEFDANYRRIRERLAKAKNIPRVEMPVINGSDVPAFQKALASGSIDIFKPWAKGKLHVPGHKLDKAEGEKWLRLGFEDGKIEDDFIEAKITKLPAGKLLPTQNQIWLDPLINATTKLGPVKSESHKWAQYTIIVSKEGYLLDGHHRWALVMLSDPGFKLPAIHVPLPLDLLLKVGSTYGAAIGNKPNV